MASLLETKILLLLLLSLVLLLEQISHSFIDVENGNSLPREGPSVALAYIAVGLLPRRRRKAPTFSWSMHTLAANGQFNGHVVIVTDNPRDVAALLAEVQKEHRHCLSTFHIVEVPSPAASKNNRAKAMEAKLYKTKLFELLPDEVSHVEQILYLDSDILVVEPIQVILDAAHQKASEYRKRVEGINSTRPSLQMIKQTKNPAEPFHSGVMLFSREASACMQEWMEVIGMGQITRDQIAFGNCSSCLDIAEPLFFSNKAMYLPDPTKPILPAPKTSSVPVSLVHYTSTSRAAAFMRRDTHAAHRKFLENIGGIPEKCLDLNRLAGSGQGGKAFVAFTRRKQCL